MEPTKIEQSKKKILELHKKINDYLASQPKNIFDGIDLMLKAQQIQLQKDWAILTVMEEK